MDGQFNLNDNLYTDTLFMVDEASMIANLGLGGTTFGSGCLLDGSSWLKKLGFVL